MLPHIFIIIIFRISDKTFDYIEHEKCTACNNLLFPFLQYKCSFSGVCIQDYLHLMNFHTVFQYSFPNNRDTPARPKINDIFLYILQLICQH